MLLDLAEALNPMLEARMKRIQDDIAHEDEIDAAETTLQLVFFDGEEAFKQWTHTDSVYGARYAFMSWNVCMLTRIQPSGRTMGLGVRIASSSAQAEPADNPIRSYRSARSPRLAGRTQSCRALLLPLDCLAVRWDGNGRAPIGTIRFLR